MTMLAALQKAMFGTPADGITYTFPAPVAELIGFKAVAVEAGRTVFQLMVRRDRHANPMGTLHGGIICDVADAAMGIASATLLELGESFTTLELKINFFRPVVEGLIEARARVVHQGRTMHYVECDVFKLPEEKQIARSSSTCLVLRGEQAKGR
jgi:uncharacterized protein (TIGR00369 family)